MSDSRIELYRRLAVANRSFSPGTPINRATLFAGRHDQIRRGIDAVFQRGMHAIIFGERGVGKTSLANCLADFIPNPQEDPAVEPPFLTPRVNCTGASTYDAVWREVFTRITFTQQVRQAGFSGKADEEVTNYAQLLPKKIGPGEVQHFLDLAARRKDLIIVIDELDKLRDAEARNLMAHTIKALSDHSVGATVLLVGVGDTVDELIAEHQSIARCLTQIAMPRMTFEDIQELVKGGIGYFNRQCQDFALRATDEALITIARLSKGMPHYAHLIAQQACCMAIEKEEQTVTKSHVVGGMNRALSGVEQSVLSTYQKAIASSHKNALYQEVLIAAAIAPTDPLGFFVVGDLRKPLNEIVGRSVTMGTYTKHLNEFCTDARGPVLQKRGEPWKNRFRFCDALMQPYVLIRALSENKVNLGVLVESDMQNGDTQNGS